MRGQTREADDYDVLHVGFLPCNELAIVVYRACQWTVLTPAGGNLIHQGIASEEIRSAFETKGVPRELWPETERKVRAMERVAAGIYSRRRKEADDEAASKRKK